MVVGSDFQSLVGNSRGGSEPNHLRCCAGFFAALTAAPSFPTQKPARAHAPEAYLFVQKPAFATPENSSFRPRFGPPDFWFKFVRKGRESRDSLRSIATYDWDLGYGGDKHTIGSPC